MNDVVDAAVLLTRQGPLLFTMWGYRAVRCNRAANDFVEWSFLEHVMQHERMLQEELLIPVHDLARVLRSHSDLSPALTGPR